MKSKAILALALAGALVAAAAPHFTMSRSAPEADATVASPEEIRLWFSQVPQENSMSIRLVDAGGALLEAGEIVQDAEDGKIFSLPVPEPLPAGRYTVAWRAIGQDGHVVRGDFSFTVAARFSTR